MSASPVPPGWDYNPSVYGQRYTIAALASIGFVIATYLALYQYRVISDVWEPFFGAGSRTILDSDLSRLLPVSDAALGAMSYLADAVLGVVGGRDRWQRRPWLVIAFGIMVGPLGLVSVALVIAQPVLYQSWCTLCIVTAIISITIIGPAMDEILATLQHLRRAYDRDDVSLWRTFWGRESC